jgi:cytochrome c556
MNERNAGRVIRKAVVAAVIGAGLVMGAGSVLAQTPQQAVAFRKGSMQVQQWYGRILVQMLKGTRPWDTAQYLRIVSILDQSVVSSTLEGFPPGSDVGDTRALPVIWSDAAGFKAALERFQAESAKALAAGKSGDEKAMRAQAGELLRSCDSCHERYRSK